MDQRNWSLLLGSAFAVLVPTTALPPQPPVHSNQPPTAQEIDQSTAFWRRAPMPGRRHYGGTRDDEAYAIAPSEMEGMNLIWHDRPLLLWQGEIAEVEINEEESGERLWSRVVSGEERYVLYAGTPLQPGQVYEWILRDRLNTSADLVVFQVMEAGERDRIAADLAELEASLQAKGATAEEMALQRANYFGDRKLWADVVWEAFSVENPSAELAALLQDVPMSLLEAAASHSKS